MQCNFVVSCAKAILTMSDVCLAWFVCSAVRAFICMQAFGATMVSTFLFQFRPKPQLACKPLVLPLSTFFTSGPCSHAAPCKGAQECTALLQACNHSYKCLDMHIFTSIVFTKPSEHRFAFFGQCQTLLNCKVSDKGCLSVANLHWQQFLHLPKRRAYLSATKGKISGPVSSNWSKVCSCMDLC